MKETTLNIVNTFSIARAGAVGKSIGFVAASAKPKIKLLKLKFFLFIMTVLIAPIKLFKKYAKNKNTVQLSEGQVSKICSS